MLNWSEQEMVSLDLRDVRRRVRMVNILDTLASKPGSSIPQAFADKASMNATYYAFNSEHVTPQAILAAHADATIARVSQFDEVLVANDTTSLDVTNQKSIDGLGYLDAVNHRGLMMHTAMAISPDGIPAGILHQQRWARLPAERGKADKRREKETEEKESQKWLDTLKAVQAAVPGTTRAILCGDRESDVYDLFAYPREAHVEVLLRSTQNRSVLHLGRQTLLHEAIRSQSPCGGCVVEVPRADGKPSRVATLTLRYATVSVLPPKNAPKRSTLAPVELQVVLVEEEHPPQGVSPLKWMLLTSLPVANAKQALRCVELYRRRWLIERFHYTLKSGCKVEELQLHSLDAFETAVATFSVVAWHLLRLTYQARLTPDVPCDILFDRAEWEALCIRTSKSRKLPKEPPTLREAVWMVAKLGGFLGRKSDGEPGVKVLWVGLRALYESVEMYAAMTGIHPPRPHLQTFQER